MSLAPNRHPRLGTLQLAEGHLVSRADGGVAVWNGATGHAFTIAVDARRRVARRRSVGRDRWPQAAPLRIRLDGKGTRETRLSTAGLRFHHVHDALQISADGKRLTARYALGEELRAPATWDVETGALLWGGPPSASVLSEWVVAGRCSRSIACCVTPARAPTCAFVKTTCARTGRRPRRAASQRPNRRPISASGNRSNRARPCGAGASRSISSNERSNASTSPAASRSPARTTE